MKTHQLSDMSRGWFIGPFEPSLMQTDVFECAVKRYTAGQKEAAHVHKIATEFTVIVHGTVRMNGEVYQDGSIIEIEPGDPADFEALTDVTTFVVKVPAVLGDKYEL